MAHKVKYTGGSLANRQKQYLSFPKTSLAVTDAENALYSRNRRIKAVARPKSKPPKPPKKMPSKQKYR